MAIAREWDIRGMRELNDTLANLGNRMAREALGSAVKAGAQPFLQAAQSTVHKDSGALAKSLAVKVKISPRNGSAYALVGPKRTKGEGNQTPGAYGLMVEVGTKPHTITAKHAKVLYNAKRGLVIGTIVKHPGAKAAPYLKPSFDRAKDAAFQAFAAQLGKKIEELAIARS